MLTPTSGKGGESAAGPPGAESAAGPPGAESAAGLTVSQLAERSGVGVPSIHHYRRLGLLPPPVQVSPTRFRYDERHVEALRAIRLLRERRGLPLATIREVLPDVLGPADQEPWRPDRWDAVQAVAEVVDEDHECTRGRLLEAARTAFVAQGFGGVNVEQLCHRVGIAKGSFYRYFPSKEAVYEAAARSVVDVVAAAAGGWRQPLSPADAAVAVDRALDPVLPLLLEVVVRAGHGERALAAVVPDVVAGVAAVVTPRLAAGSGASAGRLAVEGALDRLFRRAAGLDAPGGAT